MGNLDITIGEVSIQGVSMAKSGRDILHKINIELTRGRVGLIGRNGSGKSTLARVVCGLIKPDQGRVLVDGVDVLSQDDQSIDRDFQQP